MKDLARSIHCSKLPCVKLCFLLGILAAQLCAAQQIRQQLEVDVGSSFTFVKQPDGLLRPNYAVYPEGWTGIDLLNKTESWIHVLIQRSDSPSPSVSVVLAPKALKSQDPVMSVPFIGTFPSGVYTIETTSSEFEHTTTTLQGISTTSHGVTFLPKSLSRSVGTPQTSGSSPNSVRSAIDRIAKGSHQELPVPTQASTTPGESPGWLIENATGYQLHLYLSGPIEHDYVIQNGSSISIDLPPGDYRIAADVSDKSVLPFYAVRQLNATTRWQSHFYIAPR